MSEFTQGKWILDGYNKRVVRRVVRETTTDKPVAIVIGNSADPEQQANARLIANAPEMYDDLYEVMQFLKGSSVHEDDEFANYARIIKDTLARIDGEVAHD